MVEEVATALARLEHRPRFTDPDDLVFPAWNGTPQYHADMRARFYAALRARFYTLALGR